MDAVQFHCSFGESPLHWKQVKSPHTTSTFSLVDRELVLTVHFSAVYTFFPVSPSRLLSTPCHFCSLPILSKPPHPSTATFVSPAHPPPHSPSLPQPLPWCAALSLQHLSLIWNEEEMPPCGLTSGPSRGLPEIDACLRLMPVIQLCWFTPRTHRGAGDYTALCWRGRKADRQNEAEGAMVR